MPKCFGAMFHGHCESSCRENPAVAHLLPPADNEKYRQMAPSLREAAFVGHGKISEGQNGRKIRGHDEKTWASVVGQRHLYR